MASRARVAVVVPGLVLGGGVPAVARFLHTTLTESGRYRPDLISLATYSRDEASVRLADPRTWPGGIRVLEGDWEGSPYRHVGCLLAELEFQRYRPRRALTRLLESFDIVQLVAGSPAWAYAARTCSAPVVLQVATLIAEERKARLRRGRDPWRLLMTRIAQRIDLAALRHVRLAFVENAWMKEALSKAMGAEKVRFAPPGIDTSLFRAASYRPDGYLLSVGRLSDPRKNVRLLLEAYARLKRTEPGAPRLVLAGVQGPAPDDRALARSLGIEASIEIVEDVAASALADLYRNASLFVLSSDEEGLGLVILEAMACGLPVVSTRCGGPETSIVEGETGLMAPVGDAAALAELLRDLWRDPRRRHQMGEAGRRRAEEHFSLPAAGRRFLDEYDSLLGIGP